MARIATTWWARCGGAALLVALLLAGTFLVLDRTFPLPMERLRASSPVVVASDGQWLRGFPAADGRMRVRTGVDEVPPLFVQMLVGAEDRRFFWHPGVDPLALLRAAAQVARHGRVVSGGSTLTMQVAKLLEPRPRTVRAKLVEIFRALQLSLHHDKPAVLGMWLTLAPFGGDLEGVRAASLAWFGKEPALLRADEIALLVTLPRSPEQLRPDRFRKAARLARDGLLRRLARSDAIDRATATLALARPVPAERQSFPVRSPHLAERLVDRSAERTVTTLDAALQDGVERQLKAAVATMPAPVEVAAVIVEHASGTVRAWAGSSGWLDPTRQGMVDHVRAVRSPGSTLKPFVYGLAFDRLLVHPKTIMRDEPRHFGDYAPDNFDGGFDGDVTVAESLQRSLNLPAVNVLDRLGPVQMSQALRDAGMRLSIDDSAPPGLPIVLGGVGSTLEDLVTGFGAIAGDGRVRRLRARAADPVDPGRPLLTPAAAAALRTILSSVPKPPGARPGRVFAYKTGTSYRFKDGWAIGLDGRYVVGVWVGRSDTQGCDPCNGRGGAAPIMARLFDLLPETPLLPGPEGNPFLAAPPAMLARFDAGPARGSGVPLRLDFPVAGTILDPDQGAPVPLRASGGRLPYRWFVDGAPLEASASRRRETLWRAHAPGWSEIIVVDGDGAAARARIRLQPR